METIDDDIADRSVDFLKRQKAAGKPVFLWVNFTHMHLRTHTKPESLGQSGRWQSPLSRHDDRPRQERRHVLKALDDLGMTDDTLVMYSTDNGPHMNTWPDGGNDALPQREELELGRRYRVPCIVRWPGKFEAGTVCKRRSCRTLTGRRLSSPQRRTRCEGEASQGL
jgi:arylsulfatase